MIHGWWLQRRWKEYEHDFIPLATEESGQDAAGNELDLGIVKRTTWLKVSIRAVTTSPDLPSLASVYSASQLLVDYPTAAEPLVIQRIGGDWQQDGGDESVQEDAILGLWSHEITFRSGLVESALGLRSDVNIPVYPEEG